VRTCEVSVDPTSDSHFQEWIQARGVIGAVDTNLDSLRKLGISLVTALLTANAFLLPGSIGGASSLPDTIKFGILLSTLLLLGAVAVIDRNYTVLQEAAATRALVLEQELDLELTEIIGQRYSEEAVNLVFHLIYVFIGSVVVVLGFFVLDPSILFWVLVAIWIVWSVATLLISVNCEKHGGADWSIDRTDLNPGDAFHLTVTNLFIEPGWLRRTFTPNYVIKHTFSLRPGTEFWAIEAWTTDRAGAFARVEPSPDGASGVRGSGTRGGILPIRKGTVGSAVSLGPRETFVWTIDTKNLPFPAILSIYPCVPRPGKGRDGSVETNWTPWEFPLRRKIRLEPKVEVSPCRDSAPWPT